MMTILTMTATFGKLERAKLTCSEGLNLIHAPNEGGKSTWAAFYKAMLFGIDTRDRDKKGYLAPKNRYQPWSGSPMEGELTALWNGREIAIRRGPRGNTPFGSFSAVYTDTGEKIPDMTGENCGLMLTGVTREVFERSAFIGGDNLAVTQTPELERRIAALLTAGQEDVSFSQIQERLRGWLNRRKVNRTVGLIPKLEEELAQVEGSLEQLKEQTAHIAQVERACVALRRQHAELEGEMELHRQLAQKDLNVRFAQAELAYEQAKAHLEKLEREFARFGELPSKEELKKVQFDLQYLKVLDEEIKAAQTELEQAEEAYVQAQIAAQNDHFAGLSAQEAHEAVTADQLQHQTLLTRSAKGKKWVAPLMLLGLLALGAGVGAYFCFGQTQPLYPAVGGGVFLLLAVLALVRSSAGKKALAQAAAIPTKYGAGSMEELAALLSDYEACCAKAQGCADHAKTVRGALSDLQARKENSRTDIFAFVHTFAPEVKELFGCSAALSRALGLDHEYAAARERLEQRRLHRDDLAAQGGQSCQTLELLHAPERTEEETKAALAKLTALLAEGEQALNHALGRQQAMGDPAALFARKDELEGELTRRRTEYQALNLALEELAKANDALSQRFSPQLNTLTGRYFAYLTADRYDRVTLDRDLEGETAQTGAVRPHSALFLSRGATDQLYLAVRLAVCALCLPQGVPILLDDALTTFDDSRLRLALFLLRELGEQRQILLFTCQKREGEVLEELV